MAVCGYFLFFFKHETAYEMRISDWSSDVCSSGTVRPEPQTTRNDEVRESIETCRGEADFDEKRRAVLSLLDFSAEEPSVTGGNGDGFGLVSVFLHLLELPDRAVMDVIAIVIGETMAAGSAAVEAVGQEIGGGMGRYLQADEDRKSVVGGESGAVR